MKEKRKRKRKRKKGASYGGLWIRVAGKGIWARWAR
jgi:hypothetical protein